MIFQVFVVMFTLKTDPENISVSFLNIVVIITDFNICLAIALKNFT